MALSPSTIQDIKSELAEIRELKQQLDARERALEAILIPFHVRPLADATIGPAPGRIIVTGHHVDHIEPASKFASTGLRAAILTTLKDGPRRSPDIAVILEKYGFANDSNTPLATRVYNDLWRMAQKGVVKSEMGVFSLKS